MKKRTMLAVHDPDWQLEGTGALDGESFEGLEITVYHERFRLVRAERREPAPTLILTLEPITCESS